MSDNLVSSLIPFFGCVIRPVPEGVELTGASRNFMNAVAITPRTFRAPFTLRATAKTDSTNLRFYWHLGEVIFNWECSVRELRVHDPATRHQQGLEDRGFITTNDWHEIEWAVTASAMRVVVDGQLRFAGEGDYAGIEAPLAIGPCFGSTVTVRALTVTSG